MAKNTSIKIYGRVYQLRTDDNVDPERLATLVDEKMMELSRSNTAQSTQDLAVLTALNLAGELEQEKERVMIERETNQKRAEDLLFKVSQGLESLKS